MEAQRCLSTKRAPHKQSFAAFWVFKGKGERSLSFSRIRCAIALNVGTEISRTMNLQNKFKVVWKAYMHYARPAQPV